MKRKLNVYKLLQMLVVCSLIGFFVENTFKLVTAGYIDNRFMFLPFLLGYGMFIVAVYLLIGTPWEYFPLSDKEHKLRTPLNLIVYFVAMTLLVSVGEIALGTVVEKIGGFYYWDYSNLPFNLTRYTSLPTSLGFGLIITVFMAWCFDPLMRFFERNLQTNGWKMATVAVVSILVIDFVLSFGIMIFTGERNLLWKIRLFTA